MPGSDRRRARAAAVSRRLTPARAPAVALAAALPLLGGCGDEPRGGEVDETPAAIEAPALAPNSLIEDPPDLPVEGAPGRP